ncbi:porin [Candidatus Liberibacter brunswickensis]|uniref:porin n=1 Tax=Candidatus Liberibacter brunswickensis TaxID=1968796 RepID=UPI002FE0896E
MKLKNFFLGSVAVLSIVSYSDSFASVSNTRSVNNRCVGGYSRLESWLPCMKVNGSISGRVFKQHAKSDDKQTFPLRGEIEASSMHPTKLGPILGSMKWNVETSDILVMKFANTNLRSLAFDLPSVKLSLDELYLSMRGIKAGHYKPWKDEINHAYKAIVYNKSYNGLDKMTSLSYINSFRHLKAGLSADLLQKQDNKQGFGIGYMAAYNVGRMTSTITGGYDTDTKKVAVRGNISSHIGPRGTVDFGAIWANGANSYYDKSKYSVFAGYKVDVIRNVTVAAGAQYFWDVDSFTGDAGKNSWSTGVNATYDIQRNFQAEAAISYEHNDKKSGFDLSLGLKKSF